MLRPERVLYSVVILSNKCIELINPPTAKVQYLAIGACRVVKPLHPDGG